MAGPRYMEIANELRRQIDSGELGPDAQLPTEKELAQLYDAARNTIRDAISFLKNLRLLETRPGIGTFVVRKPESYPVTLTPDEITGFSGGEGKAWIAEASLRDREARTSDPVVEIQRADRTRAEALQIPEGESVIGRHQQRHLDEVPWSLQTSYYPLSFSRRAERLLHNEDIDEGTMAYLAEVLGIRQARYSDRLLVRAPDAVEILFFDIPDTGSVQVFEHHRTAYDTQNVPCRYTVTTYPTDRTYFIIEAVLPGE